MSNLKIFLLVPVVLLSMFLPSLHAAMSSTNYKITSMVMSSGGGAISSANFNLVSTLGQSTAVGNSSGITFQIDSGFWYTLLLVQAGDANGDGELDLKDVIAVLQIVTGQTPDEIMSQADADGDGRIGLGEAIFLLRKLSGL